MQTNSYTHSMQDMMGGIFGLELAEYDNFPYRESSSCAFVNSGRTALACILDNLPRPRRVFLPLFSCDTLREPLHEFPCSYYSCGENLAPIIPGDAGEEDLIILVNYFGLTGDRVREAAAQFPGTVIIDATMALFCPPEPGIPAFYSPRKFAGVADGGVACAPFPLNARPTKQESGLENAPLLLRRLLYGATASAEEAEQAEARLCGKRTAMSRLTRTLLRSIDFETAARKRQENYRTLHAALAEINRLPLPDEAPHAPMCYPLVCRIPELRDDLIDAGIALPLFWPEVAESTDALCPENRLTRSLLPLPLDQRYDKDDMLHLISLICGKNA